jgi:hypothetical protein
LERQGACLPGGAARQAREAFSARWNSIVERLAWNNLGVPGGGGDDSGAAAAFSAHQART